MAAREHIERAPSMYMQVAQRIADDIRQGRYQPDEVLPSEAQMVGMYGVGKHTARSAVAELRRMGLVESRQGKGTIVLASGGVLPATRIERAVHRSTKGSWSLPKAKETEAPAVTRTALDRPPALLLDQQDQDAISVDACCTPRRPAPAWPTACSSLLPPLPRFRPLQSGPMPRSATCTSSLPMPESACPSPTPSPPAPPTRTSARHWD